MKLRRRRLQYIPMLPTAITLGNGICGFLAILKLIEGLQMKSAHHLETAAWLILIAMVFDALDGKVARMTRTTSKFGAQLDTLCDMLTFGIAPALAVYTIQLQSEFPVFASHVTIAMCTFYTICAMVRLARFTIETTPDEKSHMSFTGLPTPAAAGVIASSILTWHNTNVWSANGVSILLIAVLLLGLLMVSRLPYAHVVNRFSKGFRPFVQFVEVALIIMLLVMMREHAFFICFTVYALTGPSTWLRRTAVQKAPVEEPVQDPQEPFF